MGDESSFRSRRDDLTGSGPGARAPGGNVRDAEDALAELARMIGDQDPFADFAEVSRAPQPQPEQPTRLRAPRADAPTRAPASPPVERRFEDWQPGRRTSGGREATLPPPAPAPAPYGSEGLTQRPRAPEPTIARQAYDPNAGAEDARTAVRQGYGSLAARRAAEAPAPSYAPEPTVTRGAQGGEAYGQPQYAQPAYAPQGRAAPGRDDEAAGYAYGAKSDEAYDEYDDAYDPTYDEEGYMPPHGEEIYEEEPRRRRGRTALIAVACLIGLGVAATAGIFAYRMGGSGSGTVTASGSDAPVIKADSTPTKVAAPSPEGVPGGDGQKLIYDRVGNAQTGKEKVVPREEQPVDVNAAAAAAPANPSAAPAANPAEPKKVRTVAVRADGTVVASASPVSVPPATGVAPTAYAPTQNPAPAGLPTPTPVATTPTNGAGVPVGSAAQANAAPPQAAAAGGYVVQVSSQKSEADALGSWKVLQGRYPQLLGNYKASVRKADLGDKGIYYRAQVGPFASRDDAISLCNNLRAQGGDCVVTKN